MRQILTVLKFEFTNFFRQKSFVIMTGVLVLAMAGTLSWPALRGSFNFSSGDQSERVAVISKDSALTSAVIAPFFQGLNYDFVDLPPSTDPESLIDTGEYDSALVFDSSASYVRYARVIAMGDPLDAILSQALSEINRISMMSQAGLTQDQIAEIQSTAIESRTETVSGGKDQVRTFFYTYALIFLLYFAIMMYGQFVASSVATEKSTRTMELLVTSTRPNSLMFGKILGAGLAGFFQLFLLVGSAFVFYNINSAHYGADSIVSSIFDIPPSVLTYMLIFFILGFFIYASLYAALASLVSRMEEVGTAIMPVMWVFIGAFMAVMFSMASGKVDSVLMVVLSYVPLTSPMAMFARITMSSVPFYQAAISIAILVLSTMGVGVLAAKVYRLGVLMYGNPPKLGHIIRMLKTGV